MSDERVIVFADKTVLKLRGLRIHGCKPHEIEALVAEHLQTPARVIGVTGSSLELDIYGMPPEAVCRDAAGLITAVATCEGIAASELSAIASCERAVAVDADQVPPPRGGCCGERWRDLR